MYPIGTLSAMKHFTIDEANAALATVRPAAEKMADAFRRLRALRKQLAAVEGSARGNGSRKDAGLAASLTDAAEAVSHELAEAVATLEQLGVQIKDLELGLVDFPARHPEQGTVLLCWRVGEDEIAFWHGLEEGYAGRKPLPF
jgi:hypothetical protein